MSKYAYQDQERKKLIQSMDAVQKNRDTLYYCPNFNCTAHLYICAINGSKKAYFRATKSQYPHTNNCPFKYTNTKEVNIDQFDESSFIFENALKNLLTVQKGTKSQLEINNISKINSKKSQNFPPRTIKQIYSVCKSYPVNNQYGDEIIGKMLLDDRSEYIYTKGCSGYKIVETITNKKIYDKERKEIYLYAPINSRKYTFILSFENIEFYKFYQNEIYSNKDKIIVIAGNWKPTENFNKFITNVTSKKQLLILKD